MFLSMAKTVLDSKKNGHAIPKKLALLLQEVAFIGLGDEGANENPRLGRPSLVPFLSFFV